MHYEAKLNEDDDDEGQHVAEDADFVVVLVHKCEVAGVEGVEGVPLGREEQGEDDHADGVGDEGGYLGSSINPQELDDRVHDEDNEEHHEGDANLGAVADTDHGVASGVVVNGGHGNRHHGAVAGRDVKDLEARVFAVHGLGCAVLGMVRVSRETHRPGPSLERPGMDPGVRRKEARPAS